MKNSPTIPLSAAEMEAHLHRWIPLTQAMGVQVRECSRARLVLAAPLAPNRNHLGTAFGGALHTLPTLAAYGMAWLLMTEASFDGHVVLKESHAQYHRLVTGEFTAICARPNEAEVAHFQSRLQRAKMARLNLQSTVPADGGAAVDFSGVFVAVR